MGSDNYARGAMAGRGALALLTLIAVATINKPYFKGNANKGSIQLDIRYDGSERDSMSTRLRAKHPSCFAYAGGTLHVRKDGRWDRIGRNTTKSVRYDHTCPHMKPRYNCARNDSASAAYGELATNWKLNLYPESDGDDGGRCNLWEFVNAIGGPAGLARELSASGHAKRSHFKGTINVLIAGNSYLRQIFEALVCGFGHEISAHLVQRDAKFGISKAALEKRGNRPIRMEEIGDLVAPPDPVTGTCKVTPHAQYYGEGVPLPLVCRYKGGSGEFRDEVSMVEFGGLIRFYYIFRPHTYENLTAILHDKFRLDAEDIDHFVFNDGAEKTFNGMLRAHDKWERKVIWPCKTIRRMQRRDIGRWFGADNPWITEPPDSHACMPGVPDDEANLLLFLFFFNSTFDEDD